MASQYTPYIWLLIISSVITFFLGVIVLTGQRKSKGVFYFALSMIMLTLWSLPNALEMMADTLQTKIFWGKVQYIAYCYSPITLVALCMNFTGYDKFIKSKKVICLAILPTIIIILVWTNSYHGLIRYDVYLDQSGSFPVVGKKYGVAFYIHAAYSYILNITAVILLIRALFIKKSIYLKQTVMLLIGTSVIVIPNIIYVLGLSPFKMDITPVFFGPAGIIILWSIFWYKMFELVPVARTMVTETMNLGFMVLDLQNRVMDMNPAFLKIFDIPKTQFYDMGIEKVCSKIPDLVEACQRQLPHFEFEVKHEDKNYIYEVLFNPLNDKKGNLIGKYAVVYEVTDKKQAQQEFLKHQQTLTRMEEKERLARDLHDNLGQLLGSINMQVQGINQELSNAGIDIVSDKLKQLVKVSQIAHSEVRDYIREVRSSANLDKDFVNEIKNVISLFEFQTGIYIDLNITGNLTGELIKSYLRINMLNIIKEALNNIRKHAEAQKVQVTLQITDQLLYVSVMDNGKGFCSTSSGESKGSFGLNIMQERAVLIGGQVHIESEIGKGTLVTVSVPLVEGRNLK
ncbi:MAG TPA: histidine kinase N-terminal 7TM domain-containing protein [Mobilitalea sp.]|nr:histidine kinase N-terminal 7TM domain-containing protein [Mobilitalea sp.]